MKKKKKCLYLQHSNVSLGELKKNAANLLLYMKVVKTQKQNILRNIF